MAVCLYAFETWKGAKDATDFYQKDLQNMLGILGFNIKWKLYIKMPKTDVVRVHPPKKPQRFCRVKLGMAATRTETCRVIRTDVEVN